MGMGDKASSSCHLCRDCSNPSEFLLWVPTAQGKQGKWTKKISVRMKPGIWKFLPKHRELYLLMLSCKLTDSIKVKRLRDWSLITGRGGLQNGKIAGPKLFAPPPQGRVKLFAPPPLLKSGNFS